MPTQVTRKPYPSDLTDAQWAILAPFIPEPSPEATRETISRRELVNAILYLLRTGCSWRQMPHDLPNGKTVYHYFRLWKLDGTWEKAMAALRKQVRTQMGRQEEREPRPTPSANRSKPVPCEAQSVASTAGNKIFGRKRHLLVDT